MPLKKFGNVDVVETLRSIMKQNTVYYQSDFQYDAEMFQTAAMSTERGQKTFLWLLPPVRHVLRAGAGCTAAGDGPIL